LNTLASKIDIISDYISETKVSISLILSKIQQLESQKTPTHSTEKTIDSKKLLESILLSDNLQKKPKFENFRDIVTPLKPLKSEIKINKSVLKKLVSSSVLILISNPEKAIDILSIIASQKNAPAYYLDASKTNKDKLRELLELSVKENLKFILLIEKAEQLIGKAKYIDNPAHSIEITNFIENVIKKRDYPMIILQVDDLEKIDPIILKKLDYFIFSER